MSIWMYDNCFSNDIKVKVLRFHYHRDLNEWDKSTSFRVRFLVRSVSIKDSRSKENLRIILCSVNVKKFVIVSNSKNDSMFCLRRLLPLERYKSNCYELYVHPPAELLNEQRNIISEGFIDVIGLLSRVFYLSVQGIIYNRHILTETQE